MKPIILTCLLLITACNHKKTIPVESLAEVNFNVPHSCYKHRIIEKLNLDSFVLETIQSSHFGEIDVNGNKLIFIDEKLSLFFEFSSTGHLIQRHIGKGTDPNELPLKSILFFARTTDGGYFFVGPVFDCFVFDKNFKKVDSYQINWHREQKDPSKIEKPDPSKTDIYTLAYGAGKVLIDSNIVYVPLFAQHRSFNPMTTSYATEGRMIGVMDISDGYIQKMMGRLSPIYSTNKKMQCFPYCYFDLIPDHKIMISYPVDSLIYISDKDFNIRRAFGTSGTNMDFQYDLANSLYNYSENRHKQIITRGFYRSAKYIKDVDLTFRSYQKGGRFQSDGLQVYRSDTLIGDVDVPKGFEVTGYIAPYFYSNSFIGDDSSTIKLFKFKLNL